MEDTGEGWEDERKNGSAKRGRKKRCEGHGCLVGFLFGLCSTRGEVVSDCGVGVVGLAVVVGVGRVKGEEREGRR